jgi:hypothetical protein
VSDARCWKGVVDGVLVGVDYRHEEKDGNLVLMANDTHDIKSHPPYLSSSKMLLT